MKNVLVVAVNWLGDAIFSTPVYRALKARYPQVRVSVLCVPRVKDVLAMCPDIDEIIIYDEEGVDRPLFCKFALVRLLRARRFDAAFILRRSLTRTALTFCAGIPVRVGFADPWWKGLLTRVIDECGDDMHRSDVYLSVVERYWGTPVADRRCRLVAPGEMARGWQDRLSALGVKPAERLIAVNTGGNWNLKQWPEDRFAELIREIARQNLGRVLLPGAAKDVDRVHRIAELSGTAPLITAGETGLGCLAGLFSRVDMLITGDTGPLHLANALGTPVIALFGPTSPAITGPRGGGRALLLRQEVGCNKAPCYYLACPDNRCMKAIGVQDVLQAIRTLTG